MRARDCAPARFASRLATVPVSESEVAGRLQLVSQNVKPKTAPPVPARESPAAGRQRARRGLVWGLCAVAVLLGAGGAAGLSHLRRTLPRQIAEVLAQKLGGAAVEVGAIDFDATGVTIHRLSAHRPEAGVQAELRDLRMALSLSSAMSGNGAVERISVESGEAALALAPLASWVHSLAAERPGPPPHGAPESGALTRGELPGIAALLSPHATIAVENLVARVTLPSGVVSPWTVEAAVLDRRGLTSFGFRGTATGTGGGLARYDVAVDLARRRLTARASIDSLPLATVHRLIPSVPKALLESGELDATVQLDGDGVSPDVRIHGTLALRDVALQAGWLGSQALAGLAPTIAGDLTVRRAETRLVSAAARIALGRIAIEIDGRRPAAAAPDAIEARLVVPPTPCAALLEDMPRALTAPLAGFTLTGSFGAQLTLATTGEPGTEPIVQVTLDQHCRFAAIPSWADPDRFRRPFPHHVFASDGTIYYIPRGPGTTGWTPLADISRPLVTTVLAHEDDGFYHHAGIASWGLESAILENVAKHRLRFGGSTISMQLAKNLFLNHRRTVERKFQEVVLTWMLESQMSKDEMLELYLNIIELGPDIYGIHQAAAYYFGCHPRDLTLVQAALLATFLPSPRRYHDAMIARGGLTPAATSQIRRLLGIMEALKSISPVEREAALQQMESMRLLPLL
ncbi:MAG: transglycosylase domain-containing protein [Candidatus Schekmanbacteria bacterium]|nr:transglycosylase domain-containing protein [Candidatus Schekmanbacteria bacterium]